MVLYHHLCPEVIKVVRKFIIEDDKLKEYSKIYEDAVGRSLDTDADESAGIKSFVSHVNKLPTGKEKGNFLSLDFGGPVISIYLLEFLESSCSITVQKFTIPSKYMTGKSVRLFDYLARCLSDFLKTVNLKKMARIPLGVTFGFPIEQISLQDCILLRWTKGFQCNDMIGENVFTKLKDSIRKFPDLKKIYIIGILNETVSLLLSATVQDPSCRIGIVVGHVASFCYAEKVSRIGKYHAKTFGEKNMYMSLDSGAFGEDGSLDEYRTEFDFEMDEHLKSKGKLINEKMTGMTYLGEIARLALVRCIELGLILDGDLTQKMSERDSLNHNHMMRIESDPDDDHTNCREVLSEFGYDFVSDRDCCQIQFVCRCVSRRAANLIAAQLAALMNRINELNIAIALEGEMINEYPKFEYYLIRKLVQLKKEDHSFQIIKLEPNGAARGAGVMAAIFGEEVMDRDEKLRRLPGFPMEKCHFRRTGKCLNPNCSAAHPCDTSGVNPLTRPMQAESRDLGQGNDEFACFDNSHCPKKICQGYDQL